MLRIVHLLRDGRQAIKTIYYVLFSKIVTRTGKKRRENGLIFGILKKNK